MGVPVSSRRSLQGRPKMAWLIFDCPFCSRGEAGGAGAVGSGSAPAARVQLTQSTARSRWLLGARGQGVPTRCPNRHAAACLEAVRLVADDQLKLLAVHQGLVQPEHVIWWAGRGAHKRMKTEVSRQGSGATERERAAAYIADHVTPNHQLLGSKQRHASEAGRTGHDVAVRLRPPRRHVVAQPVQLQLQVCVQRWQLLYRRVVCSGGSCL